MRFDLASPGVEVPPRPSMGEIKEVDFFYLRRTLCHDLSWYESLFESDDGANSNRCVVKFLPDI